MFGIVWGIAETKQRESRHHLYYHCLRKMVKVKRFWCILYEDGLNEPFSVNISVGQPVSDLKVAIKASLNCMRQYDAQQIPLYRVGTFQASSILCSSTMIAK